MTITLTEIADDLDEAAELIKTAMAVGIPGRHLRATILRTDAQALRQISGKIERYREFAEWVRKAPVESGVCCCGDVLAAHNQNTGHSFTDQWDRSLSNWLKELDL